METAKTNEEIIEEWKRNKAYPDLQEFYSNHSKSENDLATKGFKETESDIREMLNEARTSERTLLLSQAAQGFEEWNSQFKCKRCGHLYTEHGYDTDCMAWTCNVDDNEKCEDNYCGDEQLFDKHPHLEEAYQAGSLSGAHKERQACKTLLEKDD